MDVLTIFITGLFAGGLTCLAVQGGLLASSVAHQQHNEDGAARHSSALPVLSFLISRIAVYSLLGLILGAFGSALTISIPMRAALQTVVAVFMIGTALNLLNIHPFFRRFVIQPPRFLMRMVRNQARSRRIFGPALLGAFTVFIPCGATQAMMAYAISTGTPVYGALTMFTFILGTSPLFFAVGYVFRKMGKSVSPLMNKAAAAAIVLVALYTLYGAFMLTGNTIPFRRVSTGSGGGSGAAVKTVSRAVIYFTQSGYVTEPKEINIATGSELTLKLVNTEGAGCIQAFTIPSLGIQKVIPVGAVDQIVIKVPDVPGELAFMCSMGMYRGTIKVL